MRRSSQQKTFPRRALMPVYAILAIVLCDGLYLAISSYFYPLILSASYGIKVFALNLLPIAVFSLLCWLLTARTRVSFLLTVAIFDAVFLANQMKMTNLGQPSIIVDYISIFNMVGNSDLLTHYFTTYWHPGALVGLLVVALVLLFVEKPAFRLKFGWRLVCSALVVLLLSNFGSRALRVMYQPGETWQAWTPSDNLHNFGLLYSLSHDLGQFASGYQEYDEDRLTEILETPSRRLFDQQIGLPEVQTIIVLLSESFFDLSDMHDVAPGQYDLPEYRQLESRALTGKMLVPAYGGATLRTEFELLTGITLDLFSSHSYPLISLVLSPMNSIGWDARNEGFSTTGVHPNAATFWGRDTAYPYLGFEKFLDEKQFRRTKRSGFYVSDQALTNELKKQLDTDQKQFFFAISMENHGPWKTGRPNMDEEKLSLIEPPAALEGESRVAFQQYVYHQQAAEAALLNLIDELKNKDTRSVVLFFGDHLPALSQPFEDMGFKDGKSRYQQRTPYLIYDTHQNLSVQQGKVKAIIDVTLLGSLLMDISLKDLPPFHTQAERLNIPLSKTAARQNKDGLTDLQELQLWRFWQEPLDPTGEPWEVGGRGQDVQDKPLLPEPLNCKIEQWGPRKTYISEGFNVQPDGRSAFYVKTDCANLPLDIRIDGETMWTTRQGDVLSTSFKADTLVKQSGRHSVELYERTTGRSQLLGVFKVKRRWWPQ